MQEIIRTNDPVRISFLRAFLADAGIETFVMDGFTSSMEGSIGALPRRLMVGDDDHSRAVHLLKAADEHW